MTLEAYRSGHNEAVLKTVWEKSHRGSNPFASATTPNLLPDHIESIPNIAPTRPSFDDLISFDDILSTASAETLEWREMIMWGKKKILKTSSV